MPEFEAITTAAEVYEVTPNDSADLPYPARALWIGVPGNIKVTTVKGQIVVMPAFAGTFPVQVKKVWATGGTTADEIFALR